MQNGYRYNKYEMKPLPGRNYESNWNVPSGEEVQLRNTNRSRIIEMLPGSRMKAGGIVDVAFPFSCYVNCITKRPLDISIARKKKSNCTRRCTARFLLVDAARPLNIHILAGVNFKILSWMSNFSFIASRAPLKLLLRLKRREMPPRDVVRISRLLCKKKREKKFADNFIFAHWISTQPVAF